MKQDVAKRTIWPKTSKLADESELSDKVSLIVWFTSMFNPLVRHEFVQSTFGMQISV